MHTIRFPLVGYYWILPISCSVYILRCHYDSNACKHDDVSKWKHFPRNWPFVREIHRSPVNFPHKGQWRWALMFSLIYAWINDWVNNREAGDLRRQHGHYDVIVMKLRYKCNKHPFDYILGENGVHLKYKLNVQNFNSMTCSFTLNMHISIQIDVNSVHYYVWLFLGVQDPFQYKDTILPTKAFPLRR